MIITVIEFPRIGDAKQIFYTLAELQKHLLNEAPSDTATASDNGKSRMYLVENPSSELMGELEKHFTIDPSFFESYKYTQNWENPHQYKMLRQLPSRRKEATWYTLHYREVLKLPNDAPLAQDSHVVTHGIVPRDISTYTHSSPINKESNVTALVRRNASVWYSKVKGRKHWNGMWLFDRI
jgi:transcription elongation factor GreA-like protein